MPVVCMNMVLRANSDADLEPYTTYEYRVSAWNRRGHGLSSPSWVTTKEDVPQGVLPPHWSRVGLRDDVILLNWSSPIKANGNCYLFLLLQFYYRMCFDLFPLQEHFCHVYAQKIKRPELKG